MLELSAVRHRYGARSVVDVERFTVPRGGLVAIVGANGSGKSTLLRLLALLERPTEGRVLLDERSVWDSGRAAVMAARRRVTLVEQRPVLFRGTVLDNLAFGLRSRGIGADAARRAARDTAARLGLGPLLDRPRAELSDGEIQRVALGRALALRPDALLLDEPVSSADGAAARTLYGVLEAERRDRGLAVCLASHQLEDAYRWADDIRALADGRLSPVTPENLFRVDLPAGADHAKQVRVGPIEIAVLTEKAGPAILAVPPSDIFVSREPIASSARNVFAGRVIRLAHQRGGAVRVTADVGVELVALITEEATRELQLVPGCAVVLAFKASAVRAF